MINTIFYFPQDQAEFNSASLLGINERTICFIPGSDDATGQIVMGGRNYSGTVDVNSLTQTVQNIIQTKMPPATKHTIGGVMIGNGLNITTDGVASINDTYISNLIAAYTGGAGAGEGNFEWSWAGVYDNAEGKRSIGTLTINGVDRTIYIPKDVVGEGGGNADPYDDTDIKNLLTAISNRLTSEVNTLNGTINGILTDLNGILNETDEDVKNKIRSAFPTYKLLIQYYLENGDTTVNEYTFGQDDLDTWASLKGLIVDNGDGTYRVGWSNLSQTVSGINATITLINSRLTTVEGLVGSGGGDVDYELLQAGLYAYILDQIALSGLESTWARFVTKDKLDEWLNSKVATEAGEGYTFANVVSAAKNYDTDSEAIASLKTRVDTIEGDYVSSTNLASQVDTSISGILTENSSNNAVTNLFSRIGTAEQGISGLTSRVRTLENGNFLSEASLVTAIKNKKGEIESQAGFVTQSTLDGAKSEISSELQSGLQSAVYTEVSSQLGTATAGFATKSELDDCVKTASVIASINNSGESNVTIDADKVNINGIIDRLNVGTLVADILKDREGNEIALEYLIEKLSTPSYYTVTYRTTSPLVTVSSRVSNPTFVSAGDTYTIASEVFSVPAGYSLKNKITIKMGGVDVTSQATPISYFMYNTGAMKIKNVTGDIEVIAGEPEDTRYVKITAPRYVIRVGDTITLTQKNNIGAHSFSESWSVSDSSIAVIRPQSTGSASVSGDYYDQCEIEGNQAGYVTVTVRTNETGWNASIDILVIPANASYPSTFDAGEYYVPKNSEGLVAINPTVTWSGSEGDVTFSYSVPDEYQDKISVDSDGYITTYNTTGYAYVNVELEYEYGTITDKAGINITDSILANNPDVVHADLFGNAEGYSQMVCKTTGTGSSESISQIIYLNSTKYHLDTETYGWIGNVDNSKLGQDKFAVYISSGIYGDSINGFTISSSNPSSDRFVSNPRILSDSTGSLYLVFGVNKHEAAVTYYSGSAEKYVVSAKTVEAITEEYLDTEGIACQYASSDNNNSEINKRIRTEIITVTAPDGSKIKVIVQQDTKYGIYQLLISGDNISAYYIYPTYAFSEIHWGADKEIVKSNFAQMCINAVYGISNTDWGCTSISKISGMKSTAMGNPSIVAGAQYKIEQGVFYDIKNNS